MKKDNTMAKRKRQYNGQKKKTIQWPKEKGKTLVYKIQHR